MRRRNPYATTTFNAFVLGAALGLCVGTFMHAGSVAKAASESEWHRAATYVLSPAVIQQIDDEADSEGEADHEAGCYNDGRFGGC